MCIRAFVSSELPWIWESMSRHYSGQSLKHFVVYIQVAWRKTLFIFVKSIGIRVPFLLYFVLFLGVLFFFGGGGRGRGGEEGGEEMVLVFVFSLFYTVVIMTYNGTLIYPFGYMIMFLFSTIIGSFYCLRLPNIFILFVITGCLRKMTQNIVKCYIW